jgi:hypothetical protein
MLTLDKLIGDAADLALRADTAAQARLPEPEQVSAL